MPTYTISHGSIAAVQHVGMPDGGTVVVTDSKEDPAIRLLPEAVANVVRDQFAAVFALHYRQRQRFIDDSSPIKVTV